MAKRDPLSAERCAQLLRVLGDKDRLQIVQLLRAGRCSVSELAAQLDRDLAIVSHHLGVLRRAGLVAAKRQGKQVFYELPSRVFHPEDGCDQHLDLGCCRLEIPAG